MKRITKLTLIFLFAFTVFATLDTQAVFADEHEDPTDRKVIVHYKRWDDNYEDVDIWTWGGGSAGSADAVEPTEMSDFGMMFEFYVDDDAADEMGFIPRVDGTWDHKGGLADEDGEIPDRFIQIKEDGDFVGFNEDGVKHVFVYEGMDELIYQDDMFGPMLEGTGTLSVVFYDPDEYLDIEDWEIWTWGAGDGGFVANDDDGGVPLDTVLGVDGQYVGDAMFRVAHIPIGADADDEIGLLFRTLGSWMDQTDDVSVDVTDIKGGGVKTVFFAADEAYDSFEALEAFAMPAIIEHASALDPGSILVEFNKGITVMEDEVDIFDDAWFTVTDNNDNVIETDMITYTQGTSTVEEFMLSFPEGTLNAAAAPYTVTFQSDPDDEATKTEFVVEISDEAPTIRIVGSQTTTLELGDEYALPSFSATEVLDGESRPLYDVRVKEGHGYLSTREPGVYEIVIEAEDTFGNRTEETITVTVEDPCDPEAHLNTPTIPRVVYGAFSGLSILAIGAFVIVRRKGGE